ncbi:hypothetical protein B0H14DRAFT_3509277 [Mycena olivaceomarginata]|nr:hypothetical protein B0H14DRAFT_3509277 [Mycena olivaceomarginata]
MHSTVAILTHHESLTTFTTLWSASVVDLPSRAPTDSPGEYQRAQLQRPPAGPSHHITTKGGPSLAEPPPRLRPSEYLRHRCPACFSNLKHDASEIADVHVCIDTCFTQKKKKSPRDPPKNHPDTHFIPEEQVVRTEAYVDGVRNVPHNSARTRKRRAGVQAVEEEEDGYEHERLLLPRSILDRCEASFKAANEKRQKASTEFFENIALMALHLPHDIWGGLLYDVACAFERSCLKWGFLSLFMDRIAFAVSVFHVFGHEWACQLLYHYHNRLYILDAQIEHTQEASLFCLAEWIRRHYDTSGPTGVWETQMTAARAAEDVGYRTNEAFTASNENLGAAGRERSDASACGCEDYGKGQEEALGVDENEELEQLATSEYMRLHMNTRALSCESASACERGSLRWTSWNAPIDGYVTMQNYSAHTESAVKRREPTITKLVTEYNKLCAQIAKLICDANTPPGSMAPIPILPKGLWQVDVDDTLFQDMGIDNDTDVPSPWLSDEKVRAGIKALLELDRCDEEDSRLRREKLALQVWFREEWEIITEVIKGAVCDTDEYHLRLQQDRLVCLCATWDKCLPDMGVHIAVMPLWGPSAAQLARCRVDMHLAARGEDRHYGEDNDEGDGEVNPGEESGGEDNDFGMLDAMERADIYRNNEADY